MGRWWGCERGVLNDYFESAQSIVEFRDLLGKAAFVWIVTDPNDQVRPDCYGVLGENLLRFSLTLLSFWNGENNHLVGGTADTVRLFREGRPSDGVVLPETGPVIQIMTRRMRDVNSTIDVGEVGYLTPEPAGLSGEGELERWKRVLQNIDAFNQDVKKLLSNKRASVDESRSSLMDKEFDEANCPPAALRASWLHAVADCVSIESQALRERNWRRILLLSLLAILLEQIYSGPLPQPLFLVSAVVCAGLAYGVFRRGFGQKFEIRYLDYRALAEASRTQFYWKLAGVRDCVSDHFLRDQRDELEWIRQAVLLSELVRPAKPHQKDQQVPTELPQKVLQVATLRHWVRGQRDWLQPAKGKAEQLAKKWNDLANFFVMAGFMTTLVLVPFHLWLAPTLGATGELIAASFTAVYGLLFATAGLCKVYQHTKSFSEQANRYRRLGLTMTLATNRLEKLRADGEADQIPKLLLEVGKTALAENADWLLTHRARPPIVPLGK